MNRPVPRNARDLVSDIVALPSPPVVYERLMSVINHPRSGTADIARVITEDQSLAARLLKVVNSALFSLPHPVDSITQAIKVVGTSQIRDLALATSVMTAFRDVPADLIDMKSFWRHSLSCAVVARLIASFQRRDNVEAFFLCGLLHDIGRLVMYTSAGREASMALDMSIDSGAPLHICERAVFRFDHAQVGGALLDEWRLPEVLREAVEFHHSPSRATRFPWETASIHIADIIVNAAQWGSSGQIRVPPHEPSSWPLLGLHVSLLPRMIEKAERQLDEIIGLTSGAWGIAA